MMLQPVVHTGQGTVRGVLDDGGVAAFKGIPYAAAPFGANRFRPPRPAEPWSGVRDASGYGPTAPKAPYPAPYDRLIPEVDIPGGDCLNLNVWTPDPGGRLPVMVWLHGGAFANGSGSVPGYDGSRFARDGVVCVTLNYRLGADGFLYLGEGDPANLGLLDQIAALRWVRDNIPAFGGDPDRVTVAGESAGAMSIGALLAMQSAAGLFGRAILHSGAAHHTLGPGTGRLIGRQLADRLGVAPARRALAAVPLDRLTQAQQQLRADIAARPDPALWGEATRNLMPFEPVVDGVTLPRPPIDAIADGAAAGVDLLIGTNSDEFRLFLVPNGVIDHIPEPLLAQTAAGYGLDAENAIRTYREQRPGATPGDLLAAIATDWFYRIPAVRLAEAQIRHRPDGVFLYEFAWRPPTFAGRLGACHAVDLPFAFDNLHDTAFAPLIGTEPPQRLADALHAAWVSFIATGDPGWPAYDEKRRATLRFDVRPDLEHDPRPEERTLWEGRR
ncbi:carboxylesterase/lipase family protein [Streptomyces sp. NPDC046759]|uniref:carboxylesterase/lipase family protein n=1 Tax=Streptomyces sp. NPDC046759 TaxID=3155019 RepID=UPI0033C05E20